MNTPDLGNTYRLRVFVEVADLLSFSQAARRLFLSQPAVSRHIKELETALGLAVFERRGRDKLNLTEAGQAVYRHAKSILSSVEEMESEAKGPAGHVGGLLRIGGSNAWEPLLPALLAQFQLQHPEVTTRVYFGDSERTAGLLLQNQISLGFVTLAPRDPRLEVIPIAELELVLIVPTAHPLARQRSVTPSMLADVPFIAQLSLASTTGNRYLAQHGIIPHEIMEVDCFDGVTKAVEAGLGVAMTNRLNVREAVAQERLVIVPFAERPPNVTLLAIRNRSRLAGPTPKALLAHVVAGVSALQQADQRLRRH